MSSAFGFTFKGLYQLEVDELWELAHLIKGENHYLPHHKEVLIRGVIIPYLRDASKAPKSASKDEVMRGALVRVAKKMGIPCDDWESVSAAWLVRQIRGFWVEAFRKRVQDLDEQEQETILRQAEENLKKQAQRMGASLIPAAGIVAGEMSGFGIYLGTTTGLGAISSAIGVTFPWAVYQGATTALGVILGPIGWALAGAAVGVGGFGFLNQWLNQRDAKLQTVVIALILAIGDNPYDWFGLEETASGGELKKAYRAMLKTFHPDVLPSGLPEWVKLRFNELLLLTVENHKKTQQHRKETV
jgi:hypothetical protein